MMQAETEKFARQLQWTYWGTSDDAIDKEFYLTLQGAVIAYIKDELRKSSQRIRVGRELQLQIGSYAVHARLTNIDPPLATSFNDATSFVARYRERAKDEGQDISTFLSEIIRYPNKRLGATYATLVGLDEIKNELEQKLRFLLRPQEVEQWFQRYYPTNTFNQLQQTLLDRYPLIIFEGEVGSGKTALARSVGHILAETLGCQIALFVVNAQIRGGGHVGELTQNISRAFDEAEHCQEREQIPVILFIDEADALASARGTKQTHHEDDAGVNTLIQRVDRLRGRPMAVIFATNLFQSLDSAILRRATADFHFDRPTYKQRLKLFAKLLGSVRLTRDNLYELANSTVPLDIPGYRAENPDTDAEYSAIGVTHYRYTYSDITQRIIPYAIESAVAQNRPVVAQDFIYACKRTLPTLESPHVNIVGSDMDKYYPPDPSLQYYGDRDMNTDPLPDNIIRKNPKLIKDRPQ
ncbi:MAG: ATP-binding protein [Ktedonobacteraceae bacterium]